MQLILGGACLINTSHTAVLVSLNRNFPSITLEKETVQGLSGRAKIHARPGPPFPCLSKDRLKEIKVQHKQLFLVTFAATVKQIVRSACQHLQCIWSFNVNYGKLPLHTNTTCVVSVKTYCINN